MSRPEVMFPSSEKWSRRARTVDAWAATRDQILEVDAANLGYPVYFERASGAHVWDVDGNRFIDFNLGYGPVVLGHAEPRVLDAVVRQMAQGTCASPLWHPRQVELAELMTEVIPGAEQAYLLRTGSDATTAAVRLARIHTGRDKVLRWGYNGWHDWCAPRPEGVPDPTLSNTLKFTYNDIESVRSAFAAHPDEIACVIMMSYEYDAPAPGFLNQVKEIANAHGALFILDEMRSGFRIALGGAQEHFGVVGDLSTFSKAMANGYPISAVVGRADVLAHLGRTHMSSTFYGNPAEMAAAITTIGILRETDALARIRRLGETFVDGLTELVRAYEIPAEVVGLPVSPFLIFDESDTAGCDRKVRFFTEVVRRGVLLHPNHQWFLSAAHTEEDVQISLDACRSAFDLISNG
ncbi:aminotransferase class III-fold pyridoxal phosphate-dependent enzyme [Micromonospora sp. NIE79]|uniref:Aminotransferase class III-fold pyridoxal phosphate-dependent enzyme n=1 Tax=Micromonospora trifolii TaxID=2911208 RepID=A0ABS9NBG5_9ACTN|nr:aminotransferase class III-fold pyridoxal phosphate-dependent enzyme [Micromonospora trifolii]MCG5447296.1 aminotransferase class III-fold pyridoxal phosphate-dependent enzyme [Micromonospora trifolii]